MTADFYLSETQIAAFEQDGFIVLPKVVDEVLLTKLRERFQLRVQMLLRCYQRLGRGDGPGDDLNDNLIHLLEIAPAAYQHIDISLPMISDYQQIAGEWQLLFDEEWRQEAGIYTDESIFNLLTHPNILHIARRLVGEEVVASPVQHVRIKPPQRALSGDSAVDANVARTLWHQDEGVIDETALGVNMLTVWVAISDATVENGCMQAVRGSHRQPDSSTLPDYGLVTHCPAGDGHSVAEIYIPDEAIDRQQLVPLVANAGDVVLLHKRTVHGAGANNSRAIRWSFDLRYQPAEAPSGRECFPQMLVASEKNPQQIVRDVETYRRRWLSCRDAIINNEITPVFGSRWAKYSGAPMCA